VRTKVVASYVGIILLIVATVMVVHDLFMRNNPRGRMIALEHLAVVSPVAQTALDEKVSAPELEHRLAAVDAMTPFRTVLVGVQGYPSEKFTLLADDAARLRAGEDIYGVLGTRFPGARGPFAMRGVSVDGQLVGAVLTYHVVPNLNWGQLFGETLLRSLAIATTLALAASLLLAGHLTRPLRHLEQVARRFAGGDLDARAGLRRSDEIGTLAASFDEMADGLQRNIETRTRLLHDVSHELATPVTTIRATAEALLDGVVAPEEQRRYLESLLRQAEHLSHLVNDVTEVARFESGQIALEVGRFAAREPLEAAAETARVQDWPLEVTTCEGSAEGDPRRIFQVLQNLIANAQAHNPPGTRIRAACQVVGDRVRYSVEDDGPPIPAAEQERIFERFYKVDASRTRKGGGLGLSIVRQIVEAHHSRIRLEKGKRFVFELPLVL